MKVLWIDLTNTPHVHFFRPIISHYSDRYNVMITAREFAETVELARSELKQEPIVIGKHAGKNRTKKVMYLGSRFLQMSRKFPKFDVLLSIGSFEAAFIARRRKKRTISFDDNEISPNWIYSRFMDYSFFPAAIPRNMLIKQGFKSKSLIQYNGFKEDIYIADYKPDHGFLNTLPFENYVLVRPENTCASYVNKETTSVVPYLLRELSRQGINILYLPRYEKDREYARGIDGIHIPDSPIAGLDAVYFAQAVFSGAGTFTREAACLGTPAVSFFPGKRLLAVDKEMIKRGWLIHSRDPKEILASLKTLKRRDSSLGRSKEVKHEVLDHLDRLIED